MHTKQYFLNKRTGKLHILGYCKESKIKPYSVEYFDSENDALASTGRTMSMCGNCLKKRERIIKEAQEGNRK